MRFLQSLLLTFFPLIAVAGEPQPLWTVTDCAGAPSHIHFDEPSNRLFVSQIGGAGDAKDGDGAISCITLKGEVENCTWATGFNAPKGLAQHGDSLWVSDIDELCDVDVDDGTIVRRVAAVGARFLVGVTVTPDGTVYAADLLTSSIFKLDGETCRRCMFGPGLQSPIDLIAHQQQLVVAAWGLTEDFTTETPGRCLLVNLATEEIQPLTPPTLGNFYGLSDDEGGGYFASDWATGAIWHFCNEKRPRKVLQLETGTAGVEYIASRRMLIVAELKANRISAFEIPEKLIGD